MEKVTITVETEIHPTEDEEKVKTAVNNVLSNADITIKSNGKSSALYAKAQGKESLNKFRNMLRNDRIRDAARKMLFKSTHGTTIVFFLNKQVVFANHVSFCERTGESPQGPLKVTIETENPQQLVEWLAEKTVK